MQKANQKEFRIEELRKNETSYMSNGKDMTILLIAGSIKKVLQNEYIKKIVNTFLNHVEALKEKLKLN